MAEKIQISPNEKTLPQPKGLGQFHRGVLLHLTLGFNLKMYNGKNNFLGGVLVQSIPVSPNVLYKGRSDFLGILLWLALSFNLRLYKGRK